VIQSGDIVAKGKSGIWAKPFFQEVAAKKGFLVTAIILPLGYRFS
jgi:hypothetical protein